MQITVNGKKVALEPPTTTEDVKNSFKSDADIVILNGYPVNEPIILKEMDNVVLIKRGEIPDYSEMEHLLVSRHSPDVYEKLRNSSVGIAGVGGLGSNIAVSLARMGVGRIRFADFDVVEPSNLNRQYYFIDQIGQKKVYALYDTLLRVNPYLKYEPMDLFLDNSNYYNVFNNVDIVIEAFDRAEEKSKLTSFMLNYLKDKPFIAASGVAGLDDTSNIEIRRIKENFFMVGDFTSESSIGTGLMATRVAVAANIQAHLAVRIILELL